MKRVKEFMMPKEVVERVAELLSLGVSLSGIANGEGDTSQG